MLIEVKFKKGREGGRKKEGKKVEERMNFIVKFMWLVVFFKIILHNRFHLVSRGQNRGICWIFLY